jgi:hypothetical protein
VSAEIVPLCPSSAANSAILLVEASGIPGDTFFEIRSPNYHDLAGKEAPQDDRRPAPASPSNPSARRPGPIG